MLLEALYLVLIFLAIGLTGAVFWLVRQTQSLLGQHAKKVSEDSAHTAVLLVAIHERQAEHSLRENENQRHREQVDAEVISRLSSLATAHTQLVGVVDEHTTTLRSVESALRQQSLDRNVAETRILAKLIELISDQASDREKGASHAQTVEAGTTPWQTEIKADILTLASRMTDISTDIEVGQQKNLTAHARTNDGVVELRLTTKQIEDQVRSLIPTTSAQDIVPDQWLLGDRDKPSTLISRIDALSGDSSRSPRASISERFTISDVATTRLTEIIRSLPGIESAVSNLHPLRVVYSPETATGLQTGSLEHVQAMDGRWLPLARDGKTGHITEIGHLVSNINPMAVLSLGWQIATMVTAQKHLARIHEQLDRVDRQLSRLSTLISSQAVGTLSGNHRYLNQLGGILTNGFASHADLLAYTMKIEDIEQDSISIFEASRHRITKAVQAVRQTGKAEFIERGTPRFYDPLVNWAKERGHWLSETHRKDLEVDPFGATLTAFEEDVHLMVNALDVRLLALQTKHLMPTQKVISTTRLDDVAIMHKEIETLSEEFLDAVEDIAPEEAWWSKWIPRLFLFKKRQGYQGMRNYQVSVKQIIWQSLKDLDLNRGALMSAILAPHESLSLDCVYDSDSRKIVQMRLLTATSLPRSLRRCVAARECRLWWMLPKKKKKRPSRLQKPLKSVGNFAYHYIEEGVPRHFTISAVKWWRSRPAKPSATNKKLEVQ